MATTESMATTDQIDHEYLRARYRQERDKRVRPDGNDQYLQPTGRFASLLDDPYTPVAPRAPLHDHVDVAVIGGGFAGLVTGARLREAGVSDVRIVEGGGDVGGAWYWNRYPGAMCDTAAMVYLPLLEETGTVPSAKYVAASEIFAHARRIATTFGLYDKALLSTKVTGLEWEDDESRWRITTDRGDSFTAQFVTMGTGPLHRPKLPAVSRAETFAGHAFHTSRWDYEFTGGDPAGAPMTNLASKRVGIIGTGATAVQCIPYLGRDAGELFVFQRTPSSIDIRNNEPIDPDWFTSLEPGWQQQWHTNFATLQGGGFADQDLVKDGWTDLSQRIRDRVVHLLGAGAELTPATMRLAYEDSDDEKMTEIRERVSAIVDDPATAEALKPWYRQLCKRPCFHDEYLDTYNRPNVHLIDTEGRGVERIDASGLWVGDTHYDLDCIIFASGFEVGTAQARRSGFETVGRDGLTLTDAWADGMQSLHGMFVRGFPNLFVVGFSQGAGLVANVTQNLTEAGRTLACVIAHALENGVSEVETSEEAQAEWMHLLESTPASLITDPDCTPGYYNNEGGPLDNASLVAAARYPEGAVAFWQFIDQWRTSGDFDGLELGD